MSAISRSEVTDYLGNTPIVSLQNVASREAGQVFVKLEEFNPGGSIKARVAVEMVLKAERDGILSHSSRQTIVEATGGNTGIGLAIAGILRGYKVLLVVPDNYSEERVALLRMYGAEVLRSDHQKGNDSHIQKVRELVQSRPDIVWLDQFTNEANPHAHYVGTGAEILAQVPRVDCFVCAIGSGGTITGTGRRIKEVYPHAMVVGVQPAGCDLLKGKFVPHRIQAIAVGVKPKILDETVIDDMISVTYEDAVTTIRSLAATEGIFCGLSSGANIYGALQMASRMGKRSVIVTVAPDSGRSYLQELDLL